MCDGSSSTVDLAGKGSAYLLQLFYRKDADPLVLESLLLTGEPMFRHYKIINPLLSWPHNLLYFV